MKNALFLLMIAFVVPVQGCMCDEAAQVTQEEFGPRAMLKKYEWFKDAKAALDSKKANIEVYDAKLKALAESYGNKPRSEWSRDDREESNTMAAELAGVKASYNLLAADYNSQMSKFNWAFTNKGSLPAGATETLPREYSPYVTN